MPTDLKARLPAGVLRNCMTLKKPVETRSPSGTVRITYSVVDEEVWTEVVTLEGRDLYYAQQYAPTATARLRLRYRDDIAENWHLCSDDNKTVYRVVGHPLDVNDRHTILIIHGEMLKA